MAELTLTTVDGALEVRRAPAPRAVRAAAAGLSVGWLVTVGAAIGAGRTLGAGPVVDVLAGVLPALWALGPVIAPLFGSQLRLDRTADAVWQGGRRVATLSDIAAVQLEDFSVPGETPTYTVGLRLVDGSTRCIASTSHAATAETVARWMAAYAGVEVEWP